ncbi:MAG: beta-galactosidase [Fimbriimonas sp.]
MISLVALTVLAQGTHTFEAVGSDFRLDGKPFVVRSGEMHYPRVPRAYWRDRLRKAKAMGLNTICTYVFWNQHEATQGKYDFKDNLDLGAFLKIAKEEGLFAIVRPGPYICTELDFGGFPAWLLKDRSLKVRSKDPKFLAHTKRYLDRVGQEVRPHLLKNGGNVIMAQVENEYGSYGADHEYMAWIRDTMRKGGGYDCLLFTSDGPGQGMLSGGTLPDLTPTINFGGGAENAFKELAKFRPNTPRMIGEYWCGWFDHWGKAHHRTNIQNHVRDIEWCLKNGVSFNLYMFHGGTNFGFMQGSNGGANDYNVDVTSYDYDSPLDESGRITPKYTAFRDAIARGTGEKLPPVPTTPPTVQLPTVELTEIAPAGPIIPKPVVSDRPLSFEELGRDYGLLVYTFDAPKAGTHRLEIAKLMDYATVYVDAKRVGVLERRKGQKGMDLQIPRAGAQVDLVVEGLSRVNFGSLIPTERKGLEGPVTLGGTPITRWEHIFMELAPPKRLWNKSKNLARNAGVDMAFFRGYVDVKEVGDTFLDMRGFGKGFVWLNGRNLGRFWSIGPQQTLYVPAPWLKKGRNEIVVFDDSDKVKSLRVPSLKTPILDQVVVDRSRLHRKPGQTLDLAGLTADLTVMLTDARDAETVRFPAPVRARYVVLEARSEHRAQPYAALAEVFATGPDGKDLPRGKWKILYADSEEIDGENGSADNLIDNQPTTNWHTQWSGGEPKHPHQVVIDLGEEVDLASLRLLPRQEGVNGRVKELRIYTSRTPFRGL